MEVQINGGMIVETSSNQLFRVWDHKDYDHAWVGVPVKMVRGEYLSKKHARKVLIRKAGCQLLGSM